MPIREPFVSGRFYPGEPRACREMIDVLRAHRQASRPDLRPLGAVAPHAGWRFSGRIAVESISALAQSAPETVVIFGAVHVPMARHAALYPTGAWRTPLGDTSIDESLTDALLHAGIDRLVADETAHAHEHSIEVELPLIQVLLPDAQIVPIMVHPTSDASALGAAIGRVCRDFGTRTAFLASSDLTHYGPNFRFEPHGHGAIGIRWAHEQNDQRMIDLIRKMRDDEVIAEAVLNRNACGAGAIAATIAASRECGARKAELLSHTSSSQVAAAWGEVAADSVGYAGMILW